MPEQALLINCSTPTGPEFGSIILLDTALVGVTTNELALACEMKQHASSSQSQRAQRNLDRSAGRGAMDAETGAWGARGGGLREAVRVQQDDRL